MKKIKIGIFGTGARGQDLGKQFMQLGCEIVALCESREQELNNAAETFGPGAKTFANFEDFLSHPMDAVVLTNNFHEHAPYAIKCLQKGIHVYSECISNGTMAEGVELIRAFEQSNAIYMLAENYPQMIFNREIKKVCQSGTLGKILYAEGEYNHPSAPNDVGFAKIYNYHPNHWRNFLPRTYYITHSLGPIMWATGATPTTVTAFSIFSPLPEDAPTASQVGDRASIITTKNDDGSVFRFTGCAEFGAHHNSYRVCGTKGQIENVRGMDSQVMLRYNSWNVPEGLQETNLYQPSWNDKDEQLIANSGHGGSDYLTCRTFVECVLNNTQPTHPFDVYSAVTISSVAILAHRSALNNGTPYEIPNFKQEQWRKIYENDRLSPFYGADGSQPTIPCCSVTDFKPSEKQVELYKKALNIKND